MLHKSQRALLTADVESDGDGEVRPQRRVACHAGVPVGEVGASQARHLQCVPCDAVLLPPRVVNEGLLQPPGDVRRGTTCGGEEYQVTTHHRVVKSPSNTRPEKGQSAAAHFI